MTSRPSIRVIEEHNSRPNSGGELAAGLFDAMGVIAEALDVPPFDLTVVLSGDFTASVAARGEPGFHAERLGGIVQGKTLGRLPDFSVVDIVIDTADAEDTTEDPERLLGMVAILAHEYGHALIGRLRAAAGTTLAASADRRQTLEEAAIILAVEAADEYRCDALADDVLGGVATVQADGGEPVPVTLWTVHRDAFLYELIAALDQVHPGWPDLVQSYRERYIGLDELLLSMVQRTREVMVLLAHADAHAAAAGQPPITDGGSDQPAITLYLRDAWSPIRGALDAAGAAIPVRDKFAAADRAVQAAAVGIVGMWTRLGLRDTLFDDGSLYVRVSAPLR